MADNIREREKIAKEIAKTAESIRKKHRALKTGKIDDDIAVKTHFKPIIEPLQKIADNATILVKNEPDTDDDAGVTVKREDTLKKRKTIKRYKEEDNDDEETPKKRRHARRNISMPLDTSLPITSTPKSVQPVIPKTLVDETVFESTRNPLEVSLRNRFASPGGQEILREHFGPIAHKYMSLLLDADEKKEIDHVYGIYFDNHEMRLGNKRFDIDKDDAILIGDVRYKGTPGLYELIFMRRPDEIVYTEDDLHKYKSILMATNAHKSKYDAQGHLKGNKGGKYKHIIAPLMKVESKKSGRGMPRAMTLTGNKVDYVHWDDPNELVDRLRLLDASRQAGNNAHDNEILSIIEELREAGIIIN